MSIGWVGILFGDCVCDFVCDLAGDSVVESASDLVGDSDPGFSWFSSFSRSVSRSFSGAGFSPPPFSLIKLDKS